MTAGSIAVPTIIPLRAPQPGRPKLSIDSNTKIELNTESKDADIFYTINGKKPDPFPKVGMEKYTMQYRGPFTLPPGKQTVKAVAVSKDGMRESNHVTKVFEVEFAPPPPLDPGDDDIGFQEEMDKEQTRIGVKRAMKNLLLSDTSAWTDVSKREATQRMTGLKGQTSARFTSTRKGNISDHHLDTSRSNDLMRTERRLPSNTTQTLRLQRETDFLKCVYCFADRPLDPFARYCTECGNNIPQLPQTRISPPEPGQMSACVYCKSVVPFNTPACIVCEGPIPHQNQPQASIKLTDRVVCTLCGTANPKNLIACVTCDTRLPLSQNLNTLNSAPPQGSADKKYVKCTKCNRVNQGEARFCDWCGTKRIEFADKKPSQPSTLTCSKCRAANNPYATFCGSCGIKIDAPPRN
ncbi:hypothetical protein KUTeg_013097 [Tegillarca granosa]|uniref:DZANK-type domain-containing protein n=1 Tax=Tegillarca granosa TaxID=220873 RepID=A0ABQ9ESQ2_TEGGR|nr:hypothetical protein KUTeg_013097 [Tegillarca granosa]